MSAACSDSQTLCSQQTLEVEQNAVLFWVNIESHRRQWTAINPSYSRFNQLYHVYQEVKSKLLGMNAWFL